MLHRTIVNTLHSLLPPKFTSLSPLRQSLILLQMESSTQLLCPLNSATATDDGCSLVLELSENDPLFDKKKSILQIDGFNPKTRVKLKGTSDVDWIKKTLKVMLHVARIIHLDEAELYFGGAAGITEEFYSPRNELEALNSILSLIDVLLLSNTNTEKDVLRALRDAVIVLICDLGEKNRVNTIIVKDYSCEKENCLLEWGASNGVMTRLQIACVEGAGRGAVAAEDLRVGDIALEIPTSIVISEEHVHISDMYHILKQIEGISSETMLLLWSMREKHNVSSKFKPYFDSLPEDFNTGLSFGVNAIIALDGTLLLEEITQAKEHLRTQYGELFPALCDGYPDIFPPEYYTWDHFLWACELFYSNSMKVMFTDGELRTCLIPIAGFLNHSLYPHISHYGKVDSATNSLKFPLSRPCSAGEECFLSYGNYSSSHLITFYGFLPPGDNPYDVIPLDIDCNQGEFSEDSPMSEWTTHMVRGTWHSNRHEIFHYGLPSPLLDCFRKAQNPMHTNTFLLGNLENEMEVLTIIESIFDGTLENLKDTDPGDIENSSWDVKLALNYRDGQKKVVSSIISSCSSGRRTVEKELLKCMDEDIRG